MLYTFHWWFLIIQNCSCQTKKKKEKRVLFRIILKAKTLIIKKVRRQYFKRTSYAFFKISNKKICTEIKKQKCIFTSKKEKKTVRIIIIKCFYNELYCLILIMNVYYFQNRLTFIIWFEFVRYLTKFCMCLMNIVVIKSNKSNSNIINS